MTSIIDHLEHWAAVQPEKHFASFLDIDGRTTESYTYRQFHDRTRQLAAYLQHHPAISRGDRVLLVYPAGLEIIAAFVACARIGVIPVPVHAPTAITFAAALTKLAFVARDCQATVALTTTQFRRSYERLVAERRIAARPGPTASALNLEWITTEHVTESAFGECCHHPDPVLFLQYTSGSTSDPKGVIVSHDNVIHNARSTIDHVPTGVSWLPQCHDMGLIGYYLHPLVVGGDTYGFSPSDFLRRPSLWLLTISRVRATYASSPNFGFEYCLREDKVSPEQLGELDLSSLRVLLNASEPARADTYRRFLARFARYGLNPQAHVVAYGLAENTLAVTHYGKRVVTVDKRSLRQGALRLEQQWHPNNGQLQITSCGKALDGMGVRIVHPETRRAQSDQQIGEVWITGRSVCQGYWGRPETTREVFHNVVSDDPDDRNAYLRSGDLGFLYEDELFVCGRIKDLVIIRGVNYYPQDIETVVESALGKTRMGGVAVFNGEGEGETLVVVVEVKTRKELPDPAEIARAIRLHCNVEPDAIVFAASPAIARTTSGKVSRRLTRQRWVDGELRVIATHVCAPTTTLVPTGSSLQARFRSLLAPYHLTGHETYTLAEIGLDSLALVMLITEIKELLQEGELGNEVDVRLFQRLTVAEFFALLDRFDGASDEGIAALRHILTDIRREQDRHEMDRMRCDADSGPSQPVDIRSVDEPVRAVLLTGPTGFFGPFLLGSLLKQTPFALYALTRAASVADGFERIRSSLRRAAIWTPALERELQQRVHVVCGDIAQDHLGLDFGQWTSLATRVQAVLHNAALVNYVLDYNALHPHNVVGTRELLRFCFAGSRKQFHFVSSTIIFGWTVKETLFETDNNQEMENLEFGYAQTKWVAEQLVFAAERQGLDARIYRPSFITASTRGVASRDDIVIRLLAFMINHGLAVAARNQISFLPADIAADNLVAIFHRRPPVGRTFHVTVGDYYNMMDVVGVIASKYGFQFQYHDIPDFVGEMKRRCTKADLLYPLLDFFDRSQHHLVRMQHKRYNNDCYRQAAQVCGGRPTDPALEQTVSHLMTYMFRERLIPQVDAPHPEAQARADVTSAGG